MGGRHDGAFELRALACVHRRGVNQLIVERRNYRRVPVKTPVLPRYQPNVTVTAAALLRAFALASSMS